MSDAVTFTVEVKNINKLVNELVKLNADIDKAIKDAVKDAAIVVENEAKRNSKRGGENYPHRITGTLFNSIKTLRFEEKPNYHRADVGTTIVYGPRLELGFMGVDKLGRRYNQRPRPFLRPAVDENEKKIINAFSKSLKKTIDKVK